MRKKKESMVDTGNIVESVYAGVEQAVQKKSPKKRPLRKAIESVDDIPPKKTSIQ